MTDYVFIEPLAARRVKFAQWGLEQEPPLQTATSTGWLVPLDLYPRIPSDLLEGAYVDGYPYDPPQGRSPQGQAPRKAAAPDNTSRKAPRRKTSEAARVKRETAQKPAPEPAGDGDGKTPGHP